MSFDPQNPEHEPVETPVEEPQEPAVQPDSPTPEAPAPESEPVETPPEGDTPEVVPDPAAAVVPDPAVPAEGTVPVDQPDAVPTPVSVQLADGRRIDVSQSTDEVEEFEKADGFVSLSRANSSNTVRVRASAIISYE